MKKILFYFFGITLLTSCFNYYNTKSNNHNSHPLSLKGKSVNICEDLTEKTILYIVYVDEKSSKFWSKYDINQSNEAVIKAKEWINKESEKYNVNLNLQVVFHSLADSIKPISANLNYKSINQHLYYSVKGISKLHKWSHKISKLVNTDLSKTYTDIDKIISGREELLLNLRKIYNTNNIAIMFVLNNPIRRETSVTFFNRNTYSNFNTSEYSIISESKKPTVYAHELLHLFGADDFYTTNYQTVKIDKKLRKKYKQKYATVPVNSNNKTNILREYPNAIMRNVNLENIDNLEVSPITAYLIGWNKKENLSIRDKEFMLYGDFVELP